MNLGSLINLESPFSPSFYVVTGILFFLTLENTIPFRAATLSKLRRWRINFSMNFCNVVIIDLCFVYLLRKTTLFSGTHQLNLFEKIHLNSIGRILLTILLLDLALYWMHRLNHKLPFLWRFHRVHHTDLNVDVSSASRFHFGEVTVSTTITYTFMLLMGATLVEVRAFQVALFLMAQFGHSNIKLWSTLEKFLWLVLVPPSMHRIHHSNIKRETDSNYGTIFSFWDRLFGTFTYNVDQDKIIFGLNEFKDPNELTLFKLLKLPFRGLFVRGNASK